MSKKPVLTNFIESVDRYVISISKLDVSSQCLLYNEIRNKAEVGSNQHGDRQRIEIDRKLRDY